MLMSEEERERVAYYEGGQTIPGRWSRARTRSTG
jgi:hypothetical protein